MISQSTYKLLVASKVRGVGIQTLRHLSKERLFFELDIQEWAENFPELRAFQVGSVVYRAAVSAADSDLEASEKVGGCILSWRDAGYPKIFKNVSDSPVLLYVRGDPKTFNMKALAVIGTREPSDHGRQTAERITKYFAHRGWQIVSGLAAGLDTVAHQAALDVGASTVAVLAHGLDSVYPKQNTTLADRILAEGGLLVSEYGYGTPSTPGSFVERDRIQAALAKGVIMVQSDEIGGSWHASRAALRYQRWLLIPSPTRRDVSERNPKIRGNLRVLDSAPEGRLDFLQCSINDLSRVEFIRSKLDYDLIERKLLEIS